MVFSKFPRFFLLFYGFSMVFHGRSGDRESKTFFWFWGTAFDFDYVFFGFFPPAFFGLKVCVKSFRPSCSKLRY